MARDQVDLTPLERRDDLVDWIAQGVKPKSQFHIGTEHEKFVFTLEGHRPVPYEGRHSIRALLEGMEDDLIKAGVHGGFLGWQFEMADGQGAGEEFVEDHAEGINVRAMIDGLRLVHLLGRHVAHGAEGHSRNRERQIQRFAAQHFRQPEIGDLHAALGIDEEVLRFDVPMHEPFLVRVLEGLADLRNDRR